VTPTPNPFSFTDFNRTRYELEAMLLFSVMVAGKRADLTNAKLKEFLVPHYYNYGFPSMPPFEIVRCLIAAGQLGHALRRIRIGQYGRIERALNGLVLLDPRTCTLADLEAIPGIGPKTARMYLMHSRPGQQYAALDTHVLHFLRDVGVPDVPKTTPGKGPEYARLEHAFLYAARGLKVTPENLDQTIWRHYTISKEAAA
jgi:hypothetical protein